MQIELKILNKEFYNEERNGMLLHPLPSQATVGSAAVDLYSTQDIKLESDDVQMVSTGLAMNISSGCNFIGGGIFGLITPRSGMGHRGLVLGNTVGIIDSDYQGEIMISAWNRGKHTILIERGDKIAQMLLVPYISPEWKEINDFTSSTERGSGGFGSTS